MISSVTLHKVLRLFLSAEVKVELITANNMTPWLLRDKEASLMTKYLIRLLQENEKKKFEEAWNKK